MKMKIYSCLILSSLTFISCTSNEEIESHDTATVFNTETDSVATQKMKSFSTKNASDVISFNTPITPVINAGCSALVIGVNGTYTTTAVYGPEPVMVSNRAVRGYGMPSHQWNNINCLVLMARRDFIPGSRQVKVKSQAISIEYPFQANKTYEIKLSGAFYSIEPIPPTVICELKNTGIIPGGNDCSANGGNIPTSTDYDNYKYCRSLTPTDETYGGERTYSYFFSPTEQKGAVQISIRAPRLNYDSFGKLFLRYVTITEKPFDPSLNTLPGRGNVSDGRLPGGGRGGETTGNSRG